jgi:hypothetical protein
VERHRDRYLRLVHSGTRAYRISGSDAEDVNQTVWLRQVGTGLAVISSSWSRLPCPSGAGTGRSDG